MGDRGWALWPIPDLPRTDEQFEVAGGVVRDRITGLDWQCLGPPQHIFYDQTDAYCASLEIDGRGWRLPTRMELLSIVDYARANPAINTNVFPNTPSAPFKHARFGDATRGAPDYPSDAIDFSDGSGARDKPNPENPREPFVRCVRTTADPVRFQAHYEISAETVLDPLTGLRWARGASASCAPDNCFLLLTSSTHAAHLAYCEDLELEGYGDFRLPTLPELFSIVHPRERGLSYLRLDPDAFPTNQYDLFDDIFDTSTPVVGEEDVYWGVRMGEDGSVSRGRARRVRCVRSER